MIPVDRDSPVTEVSLDSISFVKNSMCSYEKAGQPGYRDLGFYDRDLGKKKFPHMNISPYEHFIPVTGMKKNSNTIIHFHDRTDNT